ncbi:MAG: DUF3341 domain-containing protein [Bdellovibrionales bacterium]|nr:DUF3341 domain-containing protein [Bdellovibrionales bacterium]
MHERNRPQAVLATFSDHGQAGRAVERLFRAGIPHRDISVVAPARPEDGSVGYRRTTKASEGIAAGAAGGAVIGGSLGWLAGLGALGIPGIGPFLAAGPLLSALAGVGVGGTIGGIAGALVGLGLPEYEARRYEGFVKEGRILLTVHVEDGAWADRAKRILREHEAREVSTAEEPKAPIVMIGDVRPITRADDYQFHK